jgi:RimJ/RimL family protein N-acetyltransferase
VAHRALIEPSICYFGICHEGRTTGQIFLHDIDGIDKSALVGYHIFDPRDRGRGHGTAALRLLQHHVVTRTDLQRLVIITTRDNLPSRRIALQCGFAERGSSREDPVKGIVMGWSVQRPQAPGL